MNINAECKDCPYFWKEDWEEYPICHWASRCPDDFAPCEETSYDIEDYDDYRDDQEDWDDGYNPSDEW